MNALQIVARLEDLAAEHGPDIGIVQFCALAGISNATIYRHFAGGWRQLRWEAGLSPQVSGKKKRYSDAELLRAVLRFHEHWGRMPTWAHIELALPGSESTYRRRFGGTAGLRAALRKFTEAEAARCRNLPPGAGAPAPAPKTASAAKSKSAAAAKPAAGNPAAASEAPGGVSGGENRGRPPQRPPTSGAPCPLADPPRGIY